MNEAADQRLVRRQARMGYSAGFAGVVVVVVVPGLGFSGGSGLDGFAAGVVVVVVVESGFGLSFTCILLLLDIPN